MTTDGSNLPAVSATPAATLHALPHDLAACHTMIQQLTAQLGDVALLRTQHQQALEQLAETTRQMARMEYQFQLLLRRFTGRSAEKMDPHQMALFEKLLEELAPTTPAAEPQTTPATSNTNGAPHGRRQIPADLPRERIIHDLPEEEKPCPCCGKMRCVIGKQVHEKLNWVPAKITVVEHVRLTYACRACAQAAAESGPQIVPADAPMSPIEKGLAEPGLLAYVIVSKYSDHLPLHRLERILERHGIDLARSTMCDWMRDCAALLKPLYNIMVQEVLASKVIHTDDTSVQVLDKRLPETRTGRFWVYLGDHHHPCTVFTHTATRERDGPMAFLAGWGKNQPAYLQADAYGGYDGIHKGQAGGQVIEVACWAHGRRKCYDARTSDSAASTQALAYIRLLYDVEDQAQEQFARQFEKPPPGSDSRPLAAIRLALRQELAVPRLRQFKTWLESQQAQNGGPVLPKSPMGAAITYLFNQWDALCVYTTDGALAIDNNAAERALRRIAVGRSNWTFLGSENGGHTAAILFSFIATCDRHQINVFGYLCDVLTRIAAHPMNRLAELLPQRWQKAAPTPT
jgi:transposase